MIEDVQLISHLAKHDLKLHATKRESIFQAANMLPLQEYGEKHFSKKDAWKWKSIRFDVGVPMSRKKTLRMYQNIALQMGPKTKNRPTKKEGKEGNCLAQAVVPCGENVVQLQGRTIPALQYVEGVFRRSFQTACNINEVVLLEAGEEQLLLEKAKQEEGHNER